MPLYEYYCATCVKTFESIERMGTKEVPCRKCGEQASKVISPTNFKINGYSYANGYSDKGVSKK